METIRGKHASFVDTSTLAERLACYDTIHIDIGTGDGRFVEHIAQSNPNAFVIGIDACRENLHEVSRRAPSNALFVIANARALPDELEGLANHITINFPWGSLLEGLLADDPALMSGLLRIAHPNAGLQVRLNAGAVAEAGWSLEAGANRVREVLAVNGFDMCSLKAMPMSELKQFPTTWAKRIAFGRDPRALFLRGTVRSGVTAYASESAQMMLVN